MAKSDPLHDRSGRSCSLCFDQLTVPSLDLNALPPICVLSAHLSSEEEDRIKATLRRHRATLITTDLSKAGIFIGKVGTRPRAEFELRRRKFEISPVVIEPKRKAGSASPGGNTAKRTKVSQQALVNMEDSTTEDEEEGGDEVKHDSSIAASGVISESPPPSPATLYDDDDLPTSKPNSKDDDDDILHVVRLDWLDECLSTGRTVPFGENLILKCRVLQRPKASPTTERTSIKASNFSQPRPPPRLAGTPPLQVVSGMVERAKKDAPAPNHTLAEKFQRNSGHGSHRFDGKTFSSNGSRANFAQQKAQLLQQTTSEYEGEDSDTPPVPEWVKNKIQYSCQRMTPQNPPNEDFIDQLKKLRTARTLIDDEIGVRAYSSIIAAIAAYPYRLSHPREIARLPGCDEKTSVLFVEWKNTGKIQAVEDYESDDAMGVLRSFYDIWGVGSKTARAFYYNKNWQELDDIIEYGWDQLDRVQQIGVKFYDEFKEGIPRDEVERIAGVVREHAVRTRDDRVTVTIVGGYRRGKAASGDVDLIVSHPELSATAGLVEDIVQSLEDAEWITHTLTMSLHNTHRHQETLPFRSTKAAGAGFDTLDKALVVWQDPSWPSREADRAANPAAKNPNIHRRVDIIIAPWRTVGCAVMGWSGGTTFQRDLRRYAKYVKGWKFDSSGIRSRENGEVVELEGPAGVDGSPEDAERKVFEGLGLTYVPPEMRCTY